MIEGAFRGRFSRGVTPGFRSGFLLGFLSGFFFFFLFAGCNSIRHGMLNGLGVQHHNTKFAEIKAEWPFYQD